MEKNSTSLNNIFPGWKFKKNNNYLKNQLKSYSTENNYASFLRFLICQVVSHRVMYFITPKEMKTKLLIIYLLIVLYITSCCNWMSKIIIKIIQIFETFLKVSYIMSKIYLIIVVVSYLCLLKNDKNWWSKASL